MIGDQKQLEEEKANQDISSGLTGLFECISQITGRAKSH
jgi:hypothetical protein